MKQDEVIELARQAGGSAVGGHGWTTWVGTQSTEFLERFAKLVAEKATAIEREACAKVCDAVLNEDGNWTPIGHRFAAAIRARGQA